MLIEWSVILGSPNYVNYWIHNGHRIWSPISFEHKMPIWVSILGATTNHMLLKMHVLFGYFS